MQAVAGEVDKRRVAELHAGQIPAAVGQPRHRGKGVRCHAVRQSLIAVIVPGFVLPQQLSRFGMLHRLAFKVHPSLFIVLILHGDAVAVAEMADFGQPAVLVVGPLFRRLIIDGAVRQAV